jgi:hypothetical protein
VKLLHIIALAQAIYFGLTGIWPIVHIRSFMAVTGPKIDLWLVKTVGVVIVAISIPLFTSVIHHNVTIDIMLLAIASSLGLTAIDVYYVAKKTIAKIYLMDALAEVILIAAWIMAWSSAS